MRDYGGSPLQRFRSIAQRFFHGFGIHCATHQIRIILVSCVVITSLFYPALALYASTQNTSILDNFVTSSTVTALDAQKDLVEIWTKYDALKVHDNSISRTQCGVGKALRVERLLIRGDKNEDMDALTTQTLLSTLDFEQRLEQKLQEHGHNCLARPNGHCYVLSPLLFWGHNRETLLSDKNILDRISSSNNVTLGGITITPQMVLAQRRSHHPQVAGSRFDFAEFLALTYFFPDSDCDSDTEHKSWLRIVHETLGEKVSRPFESVEPTIIALEFDNNSSKGEAWSALSLSLYVAYFGFFGYVVWSVGNMRAVHSRLGVTFTALVEIAVSTITSLSVCALVGFKVTLVPWELLPIVIVFVGAENMFNLVDAVCKTSVTLPVKQRIAEGLSRAGTSNTLKVVTYNTILGLIAAFSVGAVRQFCSFAIVVLVAHWFLAHTFFLAVLSIDMQRLELEELLRHDPSLVPQRPQSAQDNQTRKPGTPWEKLVHTAQRIARGRAAANLSLFMLLAIAAILYHTSYTAIPNDQQPAITQVASSISRSQSTSQISKDSDLYPLWRTLNPSQSLLLHLRIEVPKFITLLSESNADPMASPRSGRARPTMRTLWLIVWLVKIMILPIAGTTTALWGLLLYLLKNTELLETQKPQSESEPKEIPEDQKLENRLSFHTLPRSSPSDVEKIATSKDGSLVASIGLHNEITIQRIRKQNAVIDGTDLLLYDPSTSVCNSTLSCVAVDHNGRFVAVGTNTGAIAVWDCQKDEIRSLPILKLDHSCFAVTEMRFASIASLPSTPKQSDFSTEGEPELSLLATYFGGVAVRWSIRAGTATPYTASSRSSVVKASIVVVQPLGHYLIAFTMQNGMLELVDSQEPDPWVFSEFCVQGGESGSLPSTACAQQVELAGSHRRIVAIATDTGLVSLWDGSSGECISILDDEFGPINTLRIIPVENGTCRYCGQLPVESVLIAFSVDHTIHLYRLFLVDQTRRCSCFRHPLRHTASRESFGRRSRSNSISSQSQPPSRPVSPSRPKARLATTFETPAFPVSGHGVHSRRASEKENGRRSSELLSVPFPGDESDGEGRTQSIWNKAILVRENDISCERGGWGVVGKKVLGIRRKPRAPAKTNGAGVVQTSSSENTGLSRVTMERWEVWTLDPLTLQTQTTLLSSLSSPSEKTPSPASAGDAVPRLPFTRISPWKTTNQHAIAGFGNTIGIFAFS